LKVCCRILARVRILEFIGIIALASFLIGAFYGMPRRRRGKRKQ
jgi:hypothetical protein